MGVVSDGLTCRACGHGNRAGRKFCAECGSALAVACAICGAANEPDERFCGECGSPLAADVAPERSGVERRFVSVLFADLVGFTSLSEDRDAEDVRELLSHYFDLARTLIERHGGTVEKFIGDAVMAVWGAPAAREDDPERAVRAALELVSGVSALGDEVGLTGLGARAGVLTGEAAVTLGAVGQGMVAGDLVNSASRVQALAEPGTVLVGEATRRATDASIAYEEAGAHELKGRDEPVQLWRALRITAGRGGSLKADAAEPPFVGRERELRLLKELFHATAEEPRAHLVSVAGIAGIGKSRLALELQKYVDGLEQTVLWHAGRCPAYGDGVAFWALAEMVRMRTGISEGEEAASARSKLRATLEQYLEDAEERAWVEPRLAQLLALEAQEAGDRQELYAGWRLFFERLAERNPVVLVLEDVHWADAALLEFVDYLLDWSRDHAIFVVVLARPELKARRPQWAARDSTTLALGPLSQPGMEQLLDGFAPGLPEDIRRQVLERAEGVPLYAVETVRMLLDRGLLAPDDGRYRPRKPIEALAVPETLQALVAARLDGLAPAERSLVQDASVLGKTFTRTALAAVAPAGGDLDSPLAGLVRKEILSLKADPRSPERGQYTFLQDLVRQIAYETLARRERKARHLAVAGYLEREAEPELAEIVASHYVAALEADPPADDAATIREQARTTLVKAGERAQALAAGESAERYFEQALELTQSLLGRAELHERAGRMATLGGRTEQARAHFEQAVAAFQELGLDQPAARVTAELGLLAWRHEHDLDRAVEVLEDAFTRLAGHEQDPDLATVAVQLGRLLFFRGRPDEAFEKTELALEVAEALDLPEVLSHGWNTKALVLESRGRPREGELLMGRALETALAADVPEAALRAYNNVSYFAWRADDWQRAFELSSDGVALARRLGDRDLEEGLLQWVLGTLYMLGRWDEAVALEPELVAIGRTSTEMVLLHLGRGDREGALRRLAMIEGVLDPAEPQSVALVASQQATVALADGRPADALGAAEEGLRARDTLGLASQHVTGSLAAALEAAAALGDEPKLDELLGLIEAEAPGRLTHALRALGARFAALRAARRGDVQSADAGFAATERLYRVTPFRLAVVLVEHAEWLAAEGRAEEAEPLLDESREVFERLGAAPWLQRVAAVAAPEAALSE